MHRGGRRTAIVSDADGLTKFILVLGQAYASEISCHLHRVTGLLEYKFFTCALVSVYCILDC